jgi:Bacteriophage replication protein O
MSPPTSSRDPNDFHFDGFDNPTTTPVPDVVFDRLLAHLGEAELKALLYVIRRTFGFKKDRDPISFNQFLKGIVTRDGRQLDEGCGIRNRTALSKALKSLESKGILISDKGVDERGENTTTVYRLRFRDDGGEAVRDPYQGGTQRGVVRDPYHRSTQGGPDVVRNAYPQETVQQTEEQETVLSKGLKTQQATPKVTGSTPVSIPNPHPSRHNSWQYRRRPEPSMGRLR